VKNCLKEFLQVLIVLIGNKSDKTEERVAKTKEGPGFAKSHQMQFFETSAKKGINVSEAVEVCVAMIEKNVDEGAYEMDLGKSETKIELEEKSEGKERLFLLVC
jgi:GTPase SAR1 family protein